MKALTASARPLKKALTDGCFEHTYYKIEVSVRQFWKPLSQICTIPLNTYEKRQKA